MLCVDAVHKSCPRRSPWICKSLKKLYNVMNKLMIQNIGQKSRSIKNWGLIFHLRQLCQGPGLFKVICAISVSPVPLNDIQSILTQPRLNWYKCLCRWMYQKRILLVKRSSFQIDARSNSILYKNALGTYILLLVSFFSFW